MNSLFAKHRYPRAFTLGRMPTFDSYDSLARIDGFGRWGLPDLNRFR